MKKLLAFLGLGTAVGATWWFLRDKSLGNPVPLAPPAPPASPVAPAAPIQLKGGKLVITFFLQASPNTLITKPMVLQLINQSIARFNRCGPIQITHTTAQADVVQTSKGFQVAAVYTAQLPTTFVSRASLSPAGLQCLTAALSADPTFGSRVSNVTAVGRFS